MLAKEPLISQTFPSQDEAYWSNRKDTLPPEIVLSLPESESSTPSSTFAYSLPQTTGVQNYTSNVTASGPLSTTSNGQWDKECRIPGFVPPLFEGEDPKLKYAGLVGPYSGMTEHRASAMDHQVGGDHYRKLSIQPVEFIHKNGLGFLAGNVIKYVCRYKAKAGVQDLLKAKHYIEMLIEQERQDP